MFIGILIVSVNRVEVKLSFSVVGMCLVKRFDIGCWNW